MIYSSLIVKTFKKSKLYFAKPGVKLIFRITFRISLFKPPIIYALDIQGNMSHNMLICHSLRNAIKHVVMIWDCDKSTIKREYFQLQK